MSRPLYESQKDRDNEKKVIELAFPGYKAEKLPMTYGVDFAILSGKNVVAWAEVKCRNQLYDRPFVSLKKVLSALDLSTKTGKKVALIYSFPSGIFYKKLSNQDVLGPIEFGGRTDRGDSQDREPMLVFNINDFIRVDGS